MAIEEIIELVTGLTTANLKHDQAELINKLAELKIERAGFIAEIQELKEQVKMLQDEKENPLVYNNTDGLYYAGNTEDRQPYCPACYENTKKRIHLIPGKLKCSVCKTDYYQFKPSDVQSRHPRSTSMEGY
jgi:hypothetical protein